MVKIFDYKGFEVIILNKATKEQKRIGDLRNNEVIIQELKNGLTKSVFLEDLSYLREWN